jgi:hypothetical protein
LIPGRAENVFGTIRGSAAAIGVSSGSWKG